MVRVCTPEDIGFLVDTAVEFNYRYYDVPLNYDKALKYMESLIGSYNGVALRTDHGAIVGMFAEDPFRDWTVLIETGWYSTGRDGIRLLQEFEKYGLQADEVRMSTLEVNPLVANLLQRRGYVSVETSHRLLT